MIAIRSRSPLAFAFALAIAGIAGLAAPAVSENDLGVLSDEFEAAGSLPHWIRLHVLEEWNAEQLETWDIDGAYPGRMTMTPYTVTWFQDWVGPLAFKTVTGDFALSVDATVTGRDGVSVPLSVFSLGGVMIREPRTVTPATWTPGGENYVFLSVGYGSAQPRHFQFEVKTTVNSGSMLILSDAPGGSARLQLARIGPYVIALRQEPGQPWVVHRRYARPDLPDTLQAGLVAYTDWTKVQFFTPVVHNQTVLDPPLPPGVTDPRPDIPYLPDVTARFEYAHYFRLVLPPALQGLDLSNPGQVSDAELLAVLGENADVPGPDLTAVGEEGRHGPGLRVEAAPNPFREHVSLVLDSAVPTAARVAVFDLSGRLIRVLHHGGIGAGSQRLAWDGRDSDGRRVAAGLYLVRTQTPAGTRSTRISRLD